MLKSEVISRNNPNPETPHTPFTFHASHPRHLLRTLGQVTLSTCCNKGLANSAKNLRLWTPLGCAQPHIKLDISSPICKCIVGSGYRPRKYRVGTKDCKVCQYSIGLLIYRRLRFWNP
jgi:hypothetical protein